SEWQKALEGRVEFSIKAVAPEKAAAGCVAVAVFAAGKLSTSAKAIDRASGGRIGALLKQGDFDGKAGAALMLHGLPGVAGKRVLLAGFGKEGATGIREFRDGVRAAVRAIADAGCTDATLYFAEVASKEGDARWSVMHAAQVGLEATYRFDRLKSGKDRRRALQRIVFGITGKAAGLDAALARG